MTLDADVDVPPRDPNPEPEPDTRGFDVATGRRVGGHMPTQSYRPLRGYDTIFIHHDKATGTDAKILVPAGEPLDRGPLLVMANAAIEVEVFTPCTLIELDGMRHALSLWQIAQEQD